MSAGTVCDHVKPIDGDCPECEAEGLAFRERVRRGEEPCPICDGHRCSTQTATLTYDLTDPDAVQEHRRALAAVGLCCVIWDLDQELRRVAKYGEDEDKAVRAAAWRNQLRKLVDEHGLAWVLEEG